MDGDVQMQKVLSEAMQRTVSKYILDIDAVKNRLKASEMKVDTLSSQGIQHTRELTLMLLDRKRVWEALAGNALFAKLESISGQLDEKTTHIYEVIDEQNDKLEQKVSRGVFESLMKEHRLLLDVRFFRRGAKKS